MISKRFSWLYFDFFVKKRQKPERIPISTLFITRSILFYRHVRTVTCLIARPIFILPMCQCRHTSHRTANFILPTCQSRHMSHLIQYTISKSIRQGKNKNDKIFCIYSELLSQTGRGTLNVVNTSKKKDLQNLKVSKCICNIFTTNKYLIANFFKLT